MRGASVGEVLERLRRGDRARRAGGGERHHAVAARADRRLHGARRARQEAEHGVRDARPLRRDREGRPAPRWSCSTPASCSTGRARTRSTRSSSNSASCARDSRRRIGWSPFGVEVMGRVRDLGSIDDVCEIASRVDFVQPVLDFAHMHATSDGAFLDVDTFAAALAKADAVMTPGAAVPHPLLRHPVREPERDEASPLRRRNASCRAAARGARAVRRGRRPSSRSRRTPRRPSDQAHSRRVACAARTTST